MKKKINQQNEKLEKFQTSEITFLSSITGGVKGGNDTYTGGYTSLSSATDADQGDHDSDGV